MYVIDITITPSNVILEDYNRPNQNYWTNQNLVYYKLDMGSYETRPNLNAL
jgi:hypothetical protein